MIGAGGYVFPLVLIRDILAFPALRDGSIRLYDIDQEGAERTLQAVRRLMEHHQVHAEVSTFDTLEESLEGADFVICSFQVGGMDAYRCDVDIPRQFGVDQAVGDTLGPGGIFRGLRTAPVLRELATAIKRSCPDALLIQYANPLSINCWVTERLGIKTIGFCHSVQRTSRLLAAELDVPYADVTFDCAGINHMAWFTTFRTADTDLIPVIRETMIERHLSPGASGGKSAKAGIYEGSDERVRTELMWLTGYFQTESSHHASEYWPWFRKNREVTQRYIAQRWDYYRLSSSRNQHGRVDHIIGQPLKPSGEYAAYLIDSVVTGARRIVYGNVSNRGLVSNLPDDACVEVACVVDAAGPRPIRYGELPQTCAALNQVPINVQRLVVEAGLQGDAELVHAAAALDPLTGAVLRLDEIREMVARLFEAEAEWLPQFRVGTPEPIS